MTLLITTVDARGNITRSLGTAKGLSEIRSEIVEAVEISEVRAQEMRAHPELLNPAQTKDQW